MDSDSDSNSDASDSNQHKSSDSDGEDEQVSLIFRNYRPRDGKLREKMVARVEIPNIEAEIQQRLDAILGKDQEEVLSLAPQKANWDLKRDVKKKMAVLQRRTQKALLDLLKQKVQEQESARSSRKSTRKILGGDGDGDDFDDDDNEIIQSMRSLERESEAQSLDSDDDE